MRISDIDSHVLQQMAEDAKRASEIVEVLQRSHMLPDPQTTALLVEEANRAYEVAQQYLRSNPLPDPETLRALVDHARQAQEQARALADSHTFPAPETLRALAADATRAQEEMEAFLRSNPLPPREVLDALATTHREYLDMLDMEYGAPSEDDVEAARRLLDQLEQVVAEALRRRPCTILTSDYQDITRLVDGQRDVTVVDVGRL